MLIILDVIVSFMIGWNLYNYIHKSTKPVKVETSPEEKPEQPIIIPDLAEILQSALDMKNKFGMYFCGDTLCINMPICGEYRVVVVGLTYVGDFLKEEGKRLPSNKERLLYAKIYIKEKTEKHSEYKQCIKLVNTNL